MIRKIIVVAASIIIAVTFLGVPSRMSSERNQLAQRGQATLQPFTLVEQDAIAKGVEVARKYGLEGAVWGTAARQMSLLEAVRLTGGDMRPEFAEAAGKVGRHPSTPVWIVVIRGKVAWSQPGPPQPQFYDNMFVFINAITGEEMDYGAMGDNVPLLLYVPVTPGTVPVRTTVTPPAGPLFVAPPAMIPPTATASPFLSPSTVVPPIQLTAMPTSPRPYPAPTIRSQP
jgi:hypothetical protein